MVFGVVWSNGSKQELRAIGDYYELNATKALARGVVRLIKEQVELVAKMPFAFPAYHPSRDANIRHCVINSYRIFYQILRAPNRILVLHVRHTARQEPDL